MQCAFGVQPVLEMPLLLDGDINSHGSETSYSRPLFFWASVVPLPTAG